MSVPTWNYPLADLDTTAPQAEPVASATRAMPSRIRSVSGPRRTIISPVPTADLLTLAASLAANPVWSIGGVNYQHVGAMDVSQYQTGTSMVTTTWLQLR